MILTAPGYETGEAKPRLANPAAAALLWIAVADTICALDMLDMVWSAFSFAAWSWVGDYVISTQISTQPSSLRNANSHLAPLHPQDEILLRNYFNHQN
jgi:hypothetical protein